MSNQGYRDEVREAVREAHWTFWKVLPYALVALAVFVAIGFGLQALGIIGKDIEREVVQHSRQYIESKQVQLQALYTEYVRLQTKAVEAETSDQPKVAEALRAQQFALLSQMRREATNIPSGKVPEEIRSLLHK